MSGDTGDIENANVASGGGAGLWPRIKDHRIVQWTVAYVGIAYAIQHAVVLTGEAFEWPQLIQRISMLLLILGLPLLMAVAWYHGGKANSRITGAELSIMSILLVGVAILFYVFVRPHEPPVADNRLAIAVLPFLDLSPEKDQDYFSDGMTEEITAALAKVSGLRVVARTSAFEFKGKNVNIKTVAEQLGASHLIEGSVRKAGDRLRITAQLIRADDGTHLWAEDYDREMTDVFQIQEDIARAITASLRIPLGLKPGENLVNNRDIDPDSYAVFLRARSIFEGRQLATNGQQAAQMMVSMLEQVARRNPSYAPALVWLAAAYGMQAEIHAQGRTESLEEARAAISELNIREQAIVKRALELDPYYPGAYTMLGLLAWNQGHFVEADAAFQKSLLLNPDSVMLTVYADRLADAGYVKEALQLSEKAHADDPLNLPTATGTILARWLNGDDKGAIALAKSLPSPNGVALLTGIYASQRRFQEAADAMAPIAGNAGSAAARVAELLRKAPAATRESLPSNAQGGLVRMVYPALGGWDLGIAAHERSFDAGVLSGRTLSWVWHPANAAARRSDQFKTVVRKTGFVELWRAKGWPPQCHPTTGDDFACN